MAGLVLAEPCSTFLLTSTGLLMEDPSKREGRSLHIFFVSKFKASVERRDEFSRGLSPPRLGNFSLAAQKRSSSKSANILSRLYRGAPVIQQLCAGEERSFFW